MSGKLTNPGQRRPIDINDPGQQISLLHEQWESWKAERAPLSLNEAQLATLKSCFYAGAKGLLNCVDMAIDEGLDNEEIGKVLPAIAVEIQRFNDQRRASRN